MSVYSILFIIAISSLQCPKSEPIGDREFKAAYKSGEIFDQAQPITMDQIRYKLRDAGIFDWSQPFSDRETKELNKLFEAVEIMTTSRNRQPSNVQHNMFTALRIVERAVKKQLKEHQISETLADKFHWENLSSTNLRKKNPAHEKPL